MRAVWIYLVALALLPGAAPAFAQEVENTAEAAPPTADAAPAVADAGAPAPEPVVEQVVDVVQAARDEALRLFAARDTAGAKAAWQQVLKLDPPAWDAVAGLAGVKLITGDTAGAETDFIRALTAAPQDSRLPDIVGQAYTVAGMHETAAAYFKRAIKLESRPEYHYRLGRAYLELERYGEAQQEVDTSLAEDPQNAEMLKLAGDLALAAGDESAALVYYRRAAEAGVSYEHQLLLARLLSEQGAADAATAWEKLVEDWGMYAEAWLGRARYHKSVARYEEAIADIKQALATDAQSTAAHELWAQVLSEQGDTNGAVEHYRAALLLRSTPELYSALIGMLSTDAAFAAERDRVWAEFMAAYPNHPEALLANGDRLYEAGSFAVAAEAYARGGLAAPRDARFPQREANCRYSLGDYAGAISLYERALALRYDAGAVADLASAYMLAGQYERADQLWRRNLQEHSRDPALVMQYGLALYDKGDYAGALEQYEQGQRLSPADDRFYNRAGMCLFMLGRTADAVEQVRKAIERRPDPQYYFNLAVGCETLELTTEAAEAYRAGLERFPHDMQLLKAYSDFATEQGDYQAALNQLRVVAEMEKSAASYAQLARLAQQAGDTGQADSAFQQALVYDPGDARLRNEYALLLAALNRGPELTELLAQTRERLGKDVANGMLDELGGYWLDFSEYQRGADFMRRAIGFDPTLASAYNSLAMLQYMLGEGEGALATVKRGLLDAGDNYFGRYLEADLTNMIYGADAARPLAKELLAHRQVDGAAYELYLEILAGEDNYAEQIEIARRGVEAFPDSAELMGYLATALFSNGDCAEVIALLTDGRYTRHQWAPRHELLGLSYLEEGNYVKAVANLSAAAEESRHAELWAALGEAQYFMDRLDDARTSLRRALALDADDAAVHAWLAIVLADQGDLEGADVSISAAGQADYVTEQAEAWLLIARAKLALARGDLLGAHELVVKARMYMPGTPRFSSMLDELTVAAEPGRVR